MIPKNEWVEVTTLSDITVINKTKNSRASQPKILKVVFNNLYMAILDTLSTKTKGHKKKKWI